uniref:Uncharacterized protein LOC104245901 n=1 Tax=Nicotiana sylvestris TaxID=4096 RepID=A0A1U7YM45_NICSY|nr:PREDICTED: uncharacterized protein LOC104245901 [Nicotiana sylvestris]
MWSEFAYAFIDNFLTAETRAACAAEFKNLKQGNRSAWEYHMKFVRLSKYVIHKFPTVEARVRRLVQGLNPLTINEASTATLNSNMNYGKMVEFAQATKNRNLKNKMESEGNSKARSTGNMGDQCTASRAQPAAAMESFQARSGQQGIPPAGSVRREVPAAVEVPVTRCGKMHSAGAGRGTTQSSSLAAAASSTPSPARGSPAPAGHGAARGGAQDKSISASRAVFGIYSGR